MANNDKNKKRMPNASVEDVQFSKELADTDDLEAQVRTKKADNRAKK